MVEDNPLDAISVTVMPSTMTAASTREMRREDIPVMPVKKMVAIVIMAGNRPLQGIKLLVRIAISLSRLESMIRVPTTPAALQPSPIHMDGSDLNVKNF